MRFFTLLYITLFLFLPAGAQFAPQAGVAGSTAISATDNRIVAWAETCSVEKGWLNIADKSKGQPSLGNGSSAIGPLDGSLVSLGDSGIAVLTFPRALYNGPGPDFAVFENGFVNPADPEEAFLELAFVEVSSDGINYVRFPATSNTDTPQVPPAGVYMNARMVNNLAGKYRGGYGTPFDLEELKNEPGLDVNNITHVRIVDVIGSIDTFGSKDASGNIINDPYPTEFISGGFDLDAVAALNIPGWWPSSISKLEEKGVLISPNPATSYITVRLQDGAGADLILSDVAGTQLEHRYINGSTQKMDISRLPQGVYFLNVTTTSGKQWLEKVIKY